MSYAICRASRSLGESYPVTGTIPEQSPIMAGEVIRTEVTLPTSQIVNDAVSAAIRRLDQEWPVLERRLLSTVDQAVSKVEDRLSGAVDSRANQAAKIAKVALIAAVGVAGIGWFLSRQKTQRSSRATT